MMGDPHCVVMRIAAPVEASLHRRQADLLMDDQCWQNLQGERAGLGVSDGLEAGPPSLQSPKSLSVATLLSYHPDLLLLAS